MTKFLQTSFAKFKKKKPGVLSHTVSDILFLQVEILRSEIGNPAFGKNFKLKFGEIFQKFVNFANVSKLIFKFRNTHIHRKYIFLVKSKQ